MECVQALLVGTAMSGQSDRGVRGGVDRATPYCIVLIPEPI